MEQKFEFKKNAFPILITLVLIISISSLFIMQMNKMIETNTYNTIDELAEHDMTTITQFVKMNWRNLHNIESRIKVYNCNTIQKAQEQLNLERATSEFHSLFFVDEERIIYSDRYIVYESDELNMLAKLSWQGRSEIVRRFDYSTTKENQKEMLLYAVKPNNLVIDGKKIIALVGITDINIIQENLTIYYFKSKEKMFRGYSSVVNIYGDYIVNINRTSSLNQSQNLFDLIDSGKTSSEFDSKKVEERMRHQETFRFNYTDANGIDKLLYFVPIKNTQWYFISMVERDVFTDQIKTFIFSSITMIVIALGISMITILLMLRSRNNAILARAETKARSEFLSNMSHEIRTPLNGIIGLLYLMRTTLQQDDHKRLEEMIGKADDTAEYLLALVSDILDMSKLHAEKLKLNPEPFRLDNMIKSIEDMQRGNVEKRGISFTVDSIISTPCVIGDETRLKQVLMNIVGNATKFTPAGGRITLTVMQSHIENDRVLTKIICSDTGIGMSEEFQKTIWESFTQEHNKLSNGVRGTGLGMAITKGIIDAMGGTIEVESTLNKGSAFTINIELPITEIAASDNKKETTAQGEERTIKLLVAEDNELNAEIIMEILQNKGFEVSVAENGKIAYDLFMESLPGEYNAILMDMQMPLMDGCEAAKKIRDSNHPDAKTIKIFACTANVFQEDKDKALASGMNDFLTKPIDVDVMLSKLNFAKQGV